MESVKIHTKRQGKLIQIWRDNHYDSFRMITVKQYAHIKYMQSLYNQWARKNSKPIIVEAVHTDEKDG